LARLDRGILLRIDRHLHLHFAVVVPDVGAGGQWP
jgi:hypothetical protein